MAALYKLTDQPARAVSLVDSALTFANAARIPRLMLDKASLLILTGEVGAGINALLDFAKALLTIQPNIAIGLQALQVVMALAEARGESRQAAKTAVSTYVLTICVSRLLKCS